MAIVLVTVGSARADAQRGGGRSRPLPGVVATPQPGSHPLTGFGTLGGARDGRGDGRDGARGNPFDGRGGARGNPFDGRNGPMHPGLGGVGHFDGPRPFRNPSIGFPRGFLYGPTVVEYQAVPAPNVVYYPAPVYYGGRRTAGSSSAPASAPSDPKKSKTLIIGGGVDGGGGVMRMERPGGDTLRLTWVGNLRPIRDAQFFLADSLQQPILTQQVDMASRTADFRVRGIEPRIAYTGLTIVWANGATVTTLVPYPPRPVPAPLREREPDALR